MKKSILFICQSAIIAALYFLLTYMVAPISSGLLQCRISEALCILPCFTPAAIPGLFIGCLLFNFVSGAMLLDILFGSLATLLAAVCARWLYNKRFTGKITYFLAPLPAVAVNAFIVGWLLSDVYQVGASYAVCALYVAAGQAIACYGGGIPLLLLLNKYGSKIFRA